MASAGIGSSMSMIRTGSRMPRGITGSAAQRFITLTCQRSIVVRPMVGVTTSEPTGALAESPKPARPAIKAEAGGRARHRRC
jgi:hypothetical protein